MLMSHVEELARSDEKAFVFPSGKAPGDKEYLNQGTTKVMKVKDVMMKSYSK
jgi:hypothetical protein